MKPRRSILSVPGHLEKMHDKAGKSAVDVIMLDLEDSVPIDSKKVARRQVIHSLNSLNWQEKILSVRINGLDTPFGYGDLLEVTEQSGNLIDSIVIPKVNSPVDVHFVSRMLDGIEMNKKFSNLIGIEASIESAEGLENVTKITQASKRIKTLVFGIADYSASIRARLISLSGHGEKEEDIYPGHRWHFAISRIVMAAKAHGLMAIDAPYGNFKDIDGLRRSAVMACAIGCDGKWAIHPDQIETINQAFSPSQEDIDRAAEILEADKKAGKEKRGAIAVKGRMVDQATVRLAKQLWDQAKFLNLV
ncbi:citrate lyase subunit beta / citryl-CoA lyase [Candidatus Magnetomoraceae bacterium gMMP-1]